MFKILIFSLVIDRCTRLPCRGLLVIFFQVFHLGTDSCLCARLVEILTPISSIMVPLRT